MEHGPLGASDLEVSRVGLGCNNFGGRIDKRATAAVLDAAAEEGITFLDTADIYGSARSEEFIGELLAERRDRFVIATKFGQDTGVPGPGGSRAHLRQAIELSLARLRTDVVDLYYYHRPDGETPLAETLGAMQELVDGGQGTLARALERRRCGARGVARHRRDGRRGPEPLQPDAPRRRRRTCSRSVASTGSATCPSSLWRAGS